MSHLRRDVLWYGDFMCGIIELNSIDTEFIRKLDVIVFNRFAVRWGTIVPHGWFHCTGTSMRRICLMSGFTDAFSRHHVAHRWFHCAGYLRLHSKCHLCLMDGFTDSFTRHHAAHGRSHCTDSFMRHHVRHGWWCTGSSLRHICLMGGFTYLFKRHHVTSSIHHHVKFYILATHYKVKLITFLDFWKCNPKGMKELKHYCMVDLILQGL